MPANSVFHPQALDSLQRVCDDVAVLLKTVGHSVPREIIAEAVMNSAATSDDPNEICFTTFCRLSGEAGKSLR